MDWLCATCLAMSTVRRHAGLVPTRVRASSCTPSRVARRAAFSRTSSARSAARRTARTISERLSGFSTKSYAPSFMASTAVSTVP